MADFCISLGCYRQRDPEERDSLPNLLGTEGEWEARLFLVGRIPREKKLASAYYAM